MDAPQKHLALPLPKIYRPPIMWKIGILLVYLVFLLLFLLMLIFAILVLSSSLSLANIGFVLFAVFSCLILPLIILGVSLYIINQFCLRLELRSQGVLYSALGQCLYAPWSDITGYDLQDDFKRIIVQEGFIRGSLKEGLERNIAVHEVARWAWWWIGNGLARLIPVSRAFWGFEQNSLDLRLLGQYLRQYAPQASQS